MERIIVIYALTGNKNHLKSDVSIGINALTGNENHYGSTDAFGIYVIPGYMPC